MSRRENCALSVCLEVCFLCESIENDIGFEGLSGEILCPTCRLRLEIVTKAVALHDALVSATPEDSARTLTEGQFEHAMEAHYLAFQATGADLDTFDNLFMQFLRAKGDVTGETGCGETVDCPVSSEFSGATGQKINEGLWRRTLPFSIALLVTVSSMVALLTPSLGPFSANSGPAGRTAEMSNLDDRGMQLIRDREFEEVILFYDDRIRERSEVAVFYYRRGVAKYHLGHFVAASADFNRAAELEPRTTTFQDAFTLSRKKTAVF
jgi:hypothetical protein